MISTFFASQGLQVRRQKVSGACPRQSERLEVSHLNRCVAKDHRMEKQTTHGGSSPGSPLLPGRRQRASARFGVDESAVFLRGVVAIVQFGARWRSARLQNPHVLATFPRGAVDQYIV